MTTIQHTLEFDYEVARFQIGDYHLHCGDTFEILTDARWIPTRIEHAAGEWYLIDLGNPWQRLHHPARINW